MPRLCCMAGYVPLSFLNLGDDCLTTSHLLTVVFATVRLKTETKCILLVVARSGLTNGDQVLPSVKNQIDTFMNSIMYLRTNDYIGPSYSCIRHTCNLLVLNVCLSI